MKYSLFLSPIVWLSRFRNRCGYGVHSPFAFGFITDVIYERGMYYSYRELDTLFAFYEILLDARPRKIYRLLFRVLNFAHPKYALFLGDDAIAYEFLRKASSTTVWGNECSGQPVGFVYIDKFVSDVLDCVNSGTILVLGHLRSNKKMWDNIKENSRAVLSFDLYDVGIAMFDNQYYPTNYIVNF